jgi:hypothetical protein
MSYRVKSLAIFLLAAAVSALGASGVKPPTVKFGRDGVTIGDVTPGTPIAWVALIREQVEHIHRIRVLRGYGPAAQAQMKIAHDGADSARGIWVVADVGTGAAVAALSPTMKASARPIAVHAIAGETTVSFDSAAVEVLYVRPRHGAWTFKVADGGGRDSDGVQNGAIVMPVASLVPLKGNPHPPEIVFAGDVLLIIDPRGLRTAVLEVK